MLLLRSVVAFVALPGTVAFLVPLLLLTLAPSLPAFDSLGLPFLAAGMLLLLWCVRDFYAAGRGTLAPWSPPKHLVTVGLYRLSRNPMYVAVILVIAGWATSFHSISLASYLLVLVILFHLRVILYEEPWLAKQFGDEWMRYKAKVPRWVGPKRRQRRTSI